MTTSVLPVSLLNKQRSALALYDLTVTDGELHATSDSTIEPFAAHDYSRFKYGDYAQTERYGFLLAGLLAAHFTEQFTARFSGDIVIMGTPYKSLPNAAKLLADVAGYSLGNWGLDFNVAASRIYQHRLAEGDYGKLSSAMRDERNRQKKYFLDPTDFEGKHIVVVDDVRITGSIERSVVTLLDGIEWESLTVTNLVRLNPDVARDNPQIEDALNHASINSLRDLLPLMEQRDRFVLITRTVKRILEADEFELREFLSALEPARRAELYRAAVDDGYSQMERYAQSFRILTTFYPY